MNGILDTLADKYGDVRALELGKIKLGGLGESRPTRDGKSQWRLPRKDDHFTITTLYRNQAGDLVPDESLMQELIAECGDSDGKLRSLPVRVLSDDIEDILQAAFVWYGKASCGARSDGKTVTWIYDPKTFEPYAPPKVEPWTPEMLDMKDKRGQSMFKLHANFNCVLASKHAKWGGVYKLRTTSVISYRQLYGSLLHIAQLTGGILMGMPLQLVVRPLVVHPDGKATTVHVVHCELRGAELALIQQQAMEQARYRLEFKERIDSMNSQYRRLLVAPGEEAGMERTEIIQEFAPEAEEPLPTLPGRYGILDDENEADVIDVPSESAEPEPVESEIPW